MDVKVDRESPMEEMMRRHLSLLLEKAQECRACNEKPGAGWEKDDEYKVAPRSVGFRCAICGVWSSCALAEKREKWEAFCAAADVALFTWNTEHGKAELALVDDPAAAEPPTTLQSLSFAPVQLDNGGLAFFYSGVIVGGTGPDAEMACNNALQPFKNLFFCGYIAKFSDPRPRGDEFAITLCLLPRNNLMQHIRPFTRHFSNEGGLWLNVPEAERIDPGSVKKF